MDEFIVHEKVGDEILNRWFAFLIRMPYFQDHTYPLEIYNDNGYVKRDLPTDRSIESLPPHIRDKTRPWWEYVANGIRLYGISGEKAYKEIKQ